MIKTQGHVGSIGGLRGHSIGGTYPWMPVGYGDDTWRCVNLVTGEYEARRYNNVADCLAACEDISEGLKYLPEVEQVEPCLLEMERGAAALAREATRKLQP